MRAALVARHRVDLVDDDRLDGAQRVAPLLAGDQEIERLGGGDHEARRLAHHRAALRAGGVAGAHRHPHLGCIEAELGGDVGDLGQRPFEVLGDVDGQRLQRRHVDDARHAVDLLARARGRGRGGRCTRGRRRGSCPTRWARRPSVSCAGGDVRPRLLLRRGGALGEPAPEPLGDCRVHLGQSGWRAGCTGGPAGRRGSGTAVMDPFSRMGVTLIPGFPAEVVGSEDSTARSTHGQDHDPRGRRRRARPGVVALARIGRRGRQPERRGLRRPPRVDPGCARWPACASRRSTAATSACSGASPRWPTGASPRSSTRTSRIPPTATTRSRSAWRSSTPTSSRSTTARSTTRSSPA